MNIDHTIAPLSDFEEIVYNYNHRLESLKDRLDNCDQSDTMGRINAGVIEDQIKSVVGGLLALSKVSQLQCLKDNKKNHTITSYTKQRSKIINSNLM